MNKIISIICVYNDKLKFDSLTKASIKKAADFLSSEFDFDLIYLNNCNYNYESAAKALNHGIKLCTGQIIIFLHQDIEILDSSIFTQIISFLIDNPRTVIGVAGSNHNGKVLSNIQHGNFPTLKRVGEAVQKASLVMTLDECFFATTKDVAKTLSFDHQTCDNWHLYAVDYCLSAATKGIQSFVLPIQLNHYSSGKLNNGFYQSLRKLVRKHKGVYNRIEATCVNISTSNFGLQLYFVKNFFYQIRKKWKDNIINLWK
jgi:glycosyltransferase involved in cell wall biosynthesis